MRFAFIIENTEGSKTNKEPIVQEDALEHLQILGRMIWFGRRM